MPWPTSLIIIIKNATTGCKDVRDAIATITTPGRPQDGYTILTGESAGLTILPNFADDSIAEWEEITIIPTGELVALRDAFMGVELSNFQHAVIRKLFAHLPATGPMNPNDPLVPKITFGEPGDDSRVAVTIDMAPLSSTYDVP